jgi:hypothetical protein
MFPRERAALARDGTVTAMSFSRDGHSVLIAAQNDSGRFQPRATPPPLE